jgi:hypothetical protein
MWSLRRLICRLILQENSQRLFPGDRFIGTPPGSDHLQATKTGTGWRVATFQAPDPLLDGGLDPLKHRQCWEAAGLLDRFQEHWRKGEVCAVFVGTRCCSCVLYTSGREGTSGLALINRV